MGLIDKLKSIVISKSYLREELKDLHFRYKADDMTRCALTSNDRGVTDYRYGNYNIIVSLTTYGDRLYDAYLPIESIMQGTLKPNKIILWLQEDMKEIPLPVLLQNQVGRGLEICYCRDMRSYKKLIPTLAKYKEDAIVTIDDDVIYKETFLENLLRTHANHPDCICANVIRKVTMRGEKVSPYATWPTECVKYNISEFNMGVGVGGILYPPNCFTDEITNEEVFEAICQNADDIWFYTMAMISGRKTIKSFTHNRLGMDYYSNNDVQDVSLSKQNNSIKSKINNDTQMSAVFKKYEILSLLMGK